MGAEWQHSAPCCILPSASNQHTRNHLLKLRLIPET
jgi:hypothetical protein